MKLPEGFDFAEASFHSGVKRSLSFPRKKQQIKLLLSVQRAELGLLL